MALLGRRAQAARAETSNGGHVKTVGGTKVATGPNGNTAVEQSKDGVGKIMKIETSQVDLKNGDRAAGRSDRICITLHHT